MSAPRPTLDVLASRLGILPDYIDVTGQRRVTSDSTREALVAAMGWDASDEAAASHALEALDREAAGRLIDPVLVWREWAHGHPELGVRRSALGAARSFELEVRTEDGGRHRSAGPIPDLGDSPSWSIPLPIHPPFGYHEIHLAVGEGGALREGVQQLVMAPRQAFQPEEAIGEGPAWGVWANLYSLRGSAGWGHGNLGDLATLARFAGECGASFVGLNPLHAVANRGLSFAPYSPTSRMYRNVLYLDPERVPEFAECSAPRAWVLDPEVRRHRRVLEGAERIDHEAVLEALLPLLRTLHRCFRERHEGRGTPRDRAYRAYCQAEGRTLIDFATWEVLAERRGRPGAPACDWREWPEALRDPRSPAVAEFRDKHADEVELRCWLQFELDRQLGQAAAAAREAGCGMGLYQDLAVGASRASAEAWLAQDLLAPGVSVGAPPDGYAPEGQDWGIPPLDPHRLRADGYGFFRRMLRTGFAHAGALRLDHAMQLMRLFWIPDGRPGSEGAYVSYPVDELLGVLALESRRSRAVVVAEDLGTVPPELPGILEDWGLLRSVVVYFARDESGSFRSPAEYLPRGLATAGTHDLAPMRGLWQGSDLDLRDALGLTGRDGDRARAHLERRRERDALIVRLREEGVLAAEGEPSPEELLRALHELLDRSPSVLVAASFDDLAGEVEPVNVPGVPLERHRSWSRRMHRTLPDLIAASDVRRALAPFERRSRRRPALG